MTCKVAVVQLNAQDDQKRNIRQALRLVEKAVDHGARLIVLPEIFSYRGKIDSVSDLATVVEDIPGPSTAPFQALASQHGVTIVAGSIYERSLRSQKAYNTSVVFGPEGDIRAIYRKRKLFAVNLPGRQIREADRFLAGTESAVFRTDGFLIGLSLCFDLRFPELFQDYGKQGCHAVCCPAAFTYETGQKHWMVLLRARAIENRCYILAPNQWGVDNQGLRHYGHSAIIDPWGDVLAQARADRTEILYTELDKKVILRYHQILPASSK